MNEKRVFSKMYMFVQDYSDIDGRDGEVCRMVVLLIYALWVETLNEMKIHE